MQQTLSIIKPDAIEKNIIGKILARFEESNLRVIAAKMLHLTRDRAQKFYAIHKGKPFFDELVTFMTSGPVLVSVLYGKDAVQKNRQIMGATDPQKADKGTIRKDFAANIDKNAVHGSDSIENAKIEISFFFKKDEIFVR